MNINQLCWIPLPSRAFIPWYSTEQVPEEAKVCSPEVQSIELAVHPPRCPKDLELLVFHGHCSRGCPGVEVHVPHQSLPVDENKGQHSASSCGLLCHLKGEVIVSAFQEPPGLLMPCCVVPPTDTGVVEVSHEDQGL